MLLEPIAGRCALLVLNKMKLLLSPGNGKYKVKFKATMRYLDAPKMIKERDETGMPRKHMTFVQAAELYRTAAKAIKRSPVWADYLTNLQTEAERLLERTMV